jgi:sulfur-carrier protein adenylyltransferase/sulfurtransferase
MVDAPRITVEDLQRRMEAGEDFVLIDTRNPQAWAESDVKLPEAIRVPLDNVDESLSKIPKGKPIVAYCT